MSFENTKRRIHPIVVGLMVAGLTLVGGAASAQGGAFDQNSIRGYDYVGPYGQIGFAIGRIDWDRGIDSDASGGIEFGGGYRFLPWLALDAKFTLVGGRDNADFGPRERDSLFFAFTAGPKFYPFGLAPDLLTHVIQPYALIAIGGGVAEIDRTSIDESLFDARFVLGFDVWATDAVGFYVEGGGHVTDEDIVDGVGLFSAGAQFRF